MELMCGPHASATPQCAIAHSGSSSSGLLKRADRRAVIESVEKTEALIEIALRCGRLGGDLARIGTETVVKRRSLAAETGRASSNTAEQRRI